MTHSMLLRIALAGAVLAATSLAPAASQTAEPPPVDLSLSPLQMSADAELRFLALRYIAPGSSICIHGKCDSYDLDAYRATALLYLRTVAPQFRGYLEAVVRLDPSFRDGLADLRNVLKAMGDEPDDPQAARKLIGNLLDNLQRRLRLPARSADLVLSIDKYVDAATRDAQEQSLFYLVRALEVSRRQLYDRAQVSAPPSPMEDPCFGQAPGTLYYLPCGKMTDWGSGDLRPTDALAVERDAFDYLAQLSSWAAPSIAPLQTCAANTDEQETAVRKDIVDARQGLRTYAELSGLLDDIEQHWAALVSSAATCSNPNLWD